MFHLSSRRSWVPVDFPSLVVRAQLILRYDLRWKLLLTIQGNNSRGTTHLFQKTSFLESRPYMKKRSKSNFNPGLNHIVIPYLISTSR